MNMSTLALIFLGFLIYSAHIDVAEAADTAQNICKTQSCLESSNTLKLSMNFEVDPCDDFYKYACGNFPKWKADKFELNQWYSWFHEIQNNQTARIKDFLRSELKKSSPAAVKKVQLLYQSCIDTDAMNKKGYGPLRQLLQDVGVSTDLWFNIQTTNFSWTYSAAKMKRLLNKDFLIKVSVHPHDDEDNKKSKKIYLSVPFNDEINLPDSLNNSPSASSEELSKYSKTLVELISGSKNMTELETKMIDNEIMELATFYDQKKLLKVLTYLLSADTPSSQLFSEEMTLQELQNMTDAAISKGDGKKQFNWEEYFNTLLEGVEGARSIDLKREKFYVSNPAYFEIVAAFVGGQSPDVLERAIWLSVISSVAGMTTDEMRVLQYGDENGKLRTTTIQERCYQSVQELMGLAIEHHYLNYEAVVQTKGKIITLLKHLKTALAIIISDADWMDDMTKKAALGKIKKMDGQISHPHWLRNVTLLNEYYEDIKVFGPHDFMLTYLKWQESMVVSQLKKIGSDFHPDDEIHLNLETDPLNVNAYYSPMSNTMYVPQGIISRPLYGHDIEALNYGGLGLVIGHEITHGFDNTGRKFDASGEKANWWQGDSLAKYKNRTQCFIDSYNSIILGNEQKLQCNGRRSLDENIADNGGFRESLMAYRYYVKENGVEPLLYGFENFTHEQLYTLSFANTWCNSVTDGTLSKQIIKDTHSPNEARVKVL